MATSFTPRESTSASAEMEETQSASAEMKETESKSTSCSTAKVTRLG